MERFSVSRVNTYFSNPWKHYCKYFEKIEPKENAEYTKYMDRGSYFHKVMELMAKGKTYKEAVSETNSYGREKGYHEDAFKGGLIACERYLSENKDCLFKNIIHTEYELIYPISDTAEYIGYIDAIVDNGDGTVTLVDYKTFSNSPKEDALKYSLQANVYMYVAKELGFNVKSFVFDCVNPKEILKGRAYKTKRLEFLYSSTRVNTSWTNFVACVGIIQKNPDFSLYIPSDYAPDLYDLLYKVAVGDVVEDFGTFLDDNFIQRGSD